MTVTTRPAGAGDRALALAAHHAAYHEVVVRQFGTWDEDAQDAFFARSWDGRPGLVIILRDGEICGYARTEDKDDCTEIGEICIMPRFQGQGIGSQVLGEAITAAAARRVPLRLSVLRENRAAALYARNGFRQAGETSTHLLLELRPSPVPPYRTSEDAEEALRIAGEASGGTGIRHDLAQAVMLDCTLSVARELARITGVELPSWAEGSAAREPGL